LAESFALHFSGRAAARLDEPPLIPMELASLKSVRCPQRLFLVVANLLDSLNAELCVFSINLRMSFAFCAVAIWQQHHIKWQHWQWNYWKVLPSVEFIQIYTFATPHFLFDADSGKIRIYDCDQSGSADQTASSRRANRWAKTAAICTRPPFRDRTDKCRQDRPTSARK